MPDPSLPPEFLRLPLAHRGLHNAAQGWIENAPASIRAAIEAGYGIEIDIQPSADGVPMVFHDATLDRLTPATGAITSKSCAELGAIPLTGSGDTIPTLSEILTLVAGRVPLLIEIKDQDGALGPNIGTLHEAVAQSLEGVPGALAIMSFNPHTMAGVAQAAPHIPRGLVVDAFPAVEWPTVPATRRVELAEIPDLARIGGCFVSCNKRDLTTSAITRLKNSGTPILTWTIRSPTEEATARTVADNITFEGYRPARP